MPAIPMPAIGLRPLRDRRAGIPMPAIPMPAIPMPAIEYGAPVMFHTGTSIFPRARNKYGDPLYVDDVIADFPELKVILAHGGRPIWMDTALFLLRRSKNVFLDICSVPPKNLLSFFPWIERVAGQAMFGSDWPGPMVKDLGQNIEDFYALPLSEHSKRQILRETAERVFGR
ncbi:MAG: amidohydrolase family protein [Chloroflexi bacterium]|nr:amidohydrolase family protein [Chloroflexota bacterium]